MNTWLLDRRWRVLLAGVLTVTVPLVCLTLYVYSQVLGEFSQIVLTENQTLLNLAIYHVEEKVNSDIANGKTLAARSQFLDALRRSDAKALNGQITSFVENSDNIEGIVVTTPKAETIARYPAGRASAGADYAQNDWFKEISVSRRPYVSDVLPGYPDPGRSLFSIVIPVMDSAGGLMGILFLEPKQDYIKEVLGSMRIGSSFIYAVDRKGKLLHHPLREPGLAADPAAVPAVRRVTQGEAGIQESSDPVARETVISTFRPVQWGWGAIMQRSEEETFRPVKKITFGLFLFTAFAALFGGMVAYKGMFLLFSIQRLSLELREKALREQEARERLRAELEERVRTQDRLAITLEELASSNRDLEQFAYVASHDLQEPLRKMASFADLLKKKFGDRLGPDADRYIFYIVDGAARMRRLINDLLTYSRSARGPRTLAPTDCDRLVAQILDDMSTTLAETGAEVSMDPLPTIVADTQGLKHVFQNLITNAVKFRGEAAPHVHIGARREGRSWVFSVSDNGIGIAEDFFDRIFVMFQKLHPAAEYPGTGIGLAICKKIVERHGGRIWVESEVGRGSTFFFSIQDSDGGTAE